MRKVLTILFLLISFYSYSQITIQHSGTLKDLFITLQTQYGYRFMYSNDDINDQQKVTVSVKNTNIGSLMKYISQTINIDYNIINNQIIIKKGEPKPKIEPEVKPEIKKADPIPQKKEEEKQEDIPQKETIVKTELTDNNIVETSEEKTAEQIPVEMEEQKATAEDTSVENKTDDKKDTDEEIINTRTPNKGTEFNIALHTNLLYDIVLAPNLGIEFTLNNKISLLAHGIWAHINWSSGEKSYRLWAFNPELRYYFGENNRFYTGAMFHIGEFNFKFNDTGRQGDNIGGGITLGYMANLSDRFKLDLGLGLGYSHIKYDLYEYVDGVDYRKESKSKNLWIPVKAGVTLIWRLK